MSWSRYLVDQLRPSFGLQIATYHWYDDFTIRVRFEIIWLLQVLPQYAMVVDFAIDCQSDAPVFVDKWLCARVLQPLARDSVHTVICHTDTHNTQTFMHKN
jgi:hypothetical protein